MKYFIPVFIISLIAVGIIVCVPDRHNSPSPLNYAVGQAQEAQRIAEQTQEMLSELLRENPGLCITNPHWWAKHASTPKERKNWQAEADFLDNHK